MRRVLSDGIGFYYQPTEAFWCPTGQPCVSMGVVQSPNSYYQRATRGETILNFHKRKAAGELLPHTNFIQTSSKGSGAGGYSVTSDLGKLYYDMPWVSGQYAITTSELEERGLQYEARFPELVQAAAASIYSEGFDAGTFLGEFRELGRMFSNLLQAFVNLIKGRPEWLPWEDWWLGMRYGVRPLLFDMKEFVEVVNAFDDKRKRYSKRVGLSEATKTQEVTSYGPDTMGVTADIVVDTDWELSLRGFVTADIQPPKFAVNPLTTGWELITFSFVVDWFFTVGQSLMALSFIVLSTNHSSSGGMRLVGNRKMYSQNVQMPSGTSGTFFREGDCKGILEVRRPTPVSVTPFNRGVWLDWQQLQDLFALLKRLLNVRY